MRLRRWVHLVAPLDSVGPLDNDEFKGSGRRPDPLVVSTSVVVGDGSGPESPAATSAALVGGGVGYLGERLDHETGTPEGASARVPSTTDVWTGTMA